jgi:acyl-CoA reductase-like NAD-dependent aldehyde dehydrogenase
MEMTSQIVSINPATEEINATFEPTSARNVDRDLCCAAAAAQTWRALALSERAKSLFAMADALRANRERLARHITQEMGKPLLESRAEVDKTQRADTEVTSFGSETPRGKFPDGEVHDTFSQGRLRSSVLGFSNIASKARVANRVIKADNSGQR